MLSSDTDQDALFSRKLTASPTVRIVSAASSGISTPNSSSNAITSSTVSRLSAPRSSIKLACSVTFSGSTITALKTLQAPDRDGRDVEINSQALPLLEQEVLASQSANIDTVSGATYTSEGYIQSVQSAIDQR